MSTNLEDYYAILANSDADKWESVECRQNDPEMWWIADELPQISSKPDEIYQVKLAIEICDRCLMKEECLKLGMQNENLRWGIWGGLLSGERLALSGKRITRTTDRHAVDKARRIRARIQLPIKRKKK